MPQALDPTLFYVYAICTCADGVRVNTLENAIFMEIDKVIDQGVTEKELRKSQNNVVASFYVTIRPKLKQKLCTPPNISGYRQDSLRR